VQDRFFGNMSERARGMFRDEMNAKGLMRIARKLSDSGDLVLGGGEDFV